MIVNSLFVLETNWLYDWIIIKIISLNGSWFCWMWFFGGGCWCFNEYGLDWWWRNIATGLWQTYRSSGLSSPGLLVGSALLYNDWLLCIKRAQNWQIVNGNKFSSNVRKPCKTNSLMIILVRKCVRRWCILKAPRTCQTLLLILSLWNNITYRQRKVILESYICKKIDVLTKASG